MKRRHDHPDRPRSTDVLPAFLHEMRRGLETEEPLRILGAVSHLIAMTQPPESLEAMPTLDDLITDLIDSNLPETTAALHVLQTLARPSERANRIDTELAERDHRLPAWICGLADATLAGEAWRLTHVLGDCEDLLIGVNVLPDVDLCVRVHVSPDLDHVVMAIEVMATSLAVAVEQLRPHVDERDESLEPIALSTARAHLVRALAATRRFPPLSPTVPIHGRILEWMASYLPEGDEGPIDPPPLDFAQAMMIVDDFVSSPLGLEFADPLDHELLAGAIRLASCTGPGDPFRWSRLSTVNLLDEIAQDIGLAPEEVERLCAVLRAFIAYAHTLRGVRSELSARVVEQVGTWHAEYEADRLVDSWSDEP